MELESPELWQVKARKHPYDGREVEATVINVAREEHEIKLTLAPIDWDKIPIPDMQIKLREITS